MESNPSSDDEEAYEIGQRGVDSQVGADLDETPASKEKQGWIYQLLFPSTLSYVGQTESWVRRMRQHKECKGRSDGRIVKNAILKYGWSNVKVVVLQTLELTGLNNRERRKLLDKHEIYWIARLNTVKPNGYNITPGGDAQPMDDQETATWHKIQIKTAMNRPEVREKKRRLWENEDHRKMMRKARTESSAFMQCRKACQNTHNVLKKRRETWATKRRAKLDTLSFEDGMKLLKRLRLKALANARRLPNVSDNSRDREADARAFWDAEIENFVCARSSKALTPASDDCSLVAQTTGEQTVSTDSRALQTTRVGTAAALTIEMSPTANTGEEAWQR